MDRLVWVALLAACGGSVELGAPNNPPEWPMSTAVTHTPAPEGAAVPAVDAAPADGDVPSGPDASAAPAPPVTESPAPALEAPPAEEPPETE